MASAPAVYIVYSHPGDVAIDSQYFNDPFYRYTMPQLHIAYLGKDKMTKTVFLNIDKVSKSLNIPSGYIPNFIAKTIGAQVKNTPNEISVSGKHSSDKLEPVLFRFIEGFVLCKNCRHPELVYSPKPAIKKCRIKCQSCGWRSKIDRLDLDDKFLRWVSNNLPPKSKTHKSRRHPRKSD